MADPTDTAPLTDPADPPVTAATDWSPSTVAAMVKDLTAQRDQARSIAAALEAENARLLNPNPHVPFKRPEPPRVAPREHR